MSCSGPGGGIIDIKLSNGVLRGVGGYEQYLRVLMMPEEVIDCGGHRDGVFRVD